MVFSVSPSVEVREVDLTATIPNTTTPPAAIAGVFRWGPVGERVLIASEAGLVDRFGEPTSFNAETFFTAADFLSYSNALYVTRVEDNANTATSDYFEARYPGELGNSLEVSYVSREAFSHDLANTGDVTGTVDFNSRTLEFTSSIDFSNDLEERDILRIGNDDVGYQDLFISNIQTDTDANTGDVDYTIETDNGFTLSELDFSELSFERLWGYTNLVDGPPKEHPDENENYFHIVVIDRTGEITGRENALLEKYENVATNEESKTATGSNNFWKDILDIRSRWVRAVDYPDGINQTDINFSSNPIGYQLLDGGSDGQNEGAISFGKVAQGYDLYKEAEDVDVSIILQGKASSFANLANYIVSNITNHRRDCVAFISPPRDSVVNISNTQTQMNNILNFRNAVQSSSYWFMDSGYKYRYDKYNDKYRWIPLNGDIGGLAARVDPWESPAGYKRGTIRNIVKLAYNPTKKTQRDQLYGNDINPVFTETGQGTILFGDKTGLGDATSAFSRINVRRLFITVQKAIATASKQFLFDFNDEFTQNQFRNVVEPFLRDIQGRRGINDFRVVSDDTVNTPTVIDQNIFRANIFIAPARTINFIELTFIATRTGVEFEELVGQQF